MKNIILIGMPGSGKSTAGVLAAKMLCKSFLDVDLLIQEQEGKSLQQIIDQQGVPYFLQAEETAACSIQAENTIIATGGSVVYSEKAMDHLALLGPFVYLHLSYEGMTKRIKNLHTRGIVLKQGNSLRDMYDERLALYRRYAQITIDCEHNGVEDTVEKLKAALYPQTDF